MMLTLPVTLPLAAGAKVTSNVAVCPGVWMSPAEAPLTLKPGPKMLIFEKVTSELPDAASVTARVALLPTATSPNFKFDGLALICPGSVTVRVAALLSTVSIESKPQQRSASHCRRSSWPGRIGRRRRPTDRLPVLHPLKAEWGYPRGCHGECRCVRGDDRLIGGLIRNRRRRRINARTPRQGSAACQRNGHEGEENERNAASQNSGFYPSVVATWRVQTHRLNGPPAECANLLFPGTD